MDFQSDGRVFLNHRGTPLTRFGVRYILARHVDRARPGVATLGRKRLHPHSMRHITAVALLKSGVDLSTISQWLGHASPTTTNRYATINLDMKRDAINRVTPCRRNLSLRNQPASPSGHSPRTRLSRESLLRLTLHYICTLLMRICRRRRRKCLSGAAEWPPACPATARPPCETRPLGALRASVVHLRALSIGLSDS